MMEKIYPKMLESFEKNQFSILATIIRQSGSSPRGVGTRFLILEEGRYVGTIGGGLLESQVLEAAKEVFMTHSPRRMKFSLTGVHVEETDMLCGGEVDLFLEPISPRHQHHIQIYQRAVEIGRRGGSAILATIISADRWGAEEVPKILMEADGKKMGSLLGDPGIEKSLRGKIDQILKKGEPSITLCRDDKGDELDLFIEPIISEPVLYIFGGGHISTQLAPLAGNVGFKVVVIDDRPEFADASRFPEAAEVHPYPFEGVMNNLSVDESSYLVIVTRGHTHDKSVLAQSLKTPAKYIGMIGSRRKRDMIYQKLMEEGFPRNALNRVHSPIGLPIGAETPEEIAVSIVAELIMVRAGIKKNFLINVNPDGFLKSRHPVARPPQ
ncbi:MAG: XdhC family aldehyde oxidoreductase maturation factor [Pseudomonadota bacterium]